MTKFFKAISFQPGYNARFDGATLDNGDVCTGVIVVEDGNAWFVCQDCDGNEYSTLEMPCIRVNLGVLPSGVSVQSY
jgi:hypothetical protein